MSGSSAPFAIRRATIAPAVVERPATRMRPLAWRASAVPKSSPPKSTAALPPVPNVVSSAPLGFSRATWTLPPSGPEKPPTRSLPLGSTSTAVARPIGPQLNSTFPSPENEVSSEPFGFSRATATRKSESPTSTILPSGCSAAPNAPSSSPPKGTVRLPPVPNVVSRLPLARSRATQNRRAAVPSAGDHDPPVRLHQHRLRFVVAAEVDPLLAVAGEARIEVTRGHVLTLLPLRPAPLCRDV